VLDPEVAAALEVAVARPGVPVRQAVYGLVAGALAELRDCVEAERPLCVAAADVLAAARARQWGRARLAAVPLCRSAPLPARLDGRPFPGLTLLLEEVAAAARRVWRPDDLGALVAVSRALARLGPVAQDVLTEAVTCLVEDVTAESPTPDPLVADVCPELSLTRAWLAARRPVGGAALAPAVFGGGLRLRQVALRHRAALPDVVVTTARVLIELHAADPPD